MNLKKAFVFLLFVAFSLVLHAQAFRGTTGLLHAPTAEMEKDKTFKFGANYLDLVPLHYLMFKGEISHTYNYYLNMTFFPWLEVSYICTLNYAEHGGTYFPEYVWGKYTNQDRAFSGRLRIWKEGWWKDWTPQIVAGMDDASSHTAWGGGDVQIGDGQNNFMTRIYIAATKHMAFTNIGEAGLHVAYNWGRGKGVGAQFEGTSVGANFRVKLPEGGDGLFSGKEFHWQQVANGFNLMAEYDARTFNVGGTYSLWKDQINIVAELNDGKYFTAGMYFKIHLK